MYFPLHSLAHFATDDGEEGPIKWSDRGRDTLEPLLDWGSADTVYLTYGRVYLLVVLAFLLGLVSLLARRARELQGLERWSFGIALVGYALLVAGAVVEYWTPYIGFGFMAFSGPGVLVALLGSTLLGIALLRRRAVPRGGAWLLALSIPLLFGMLVLVGHLSAGLLPLDLAWLVIGWWVWSVTPLGEGRQSRLRRRAPAP